MEEEKVMRQVEIDNEQPVKQELSTIDLTAFILHSMVKGKGDL